MRTSRILLVFVIIGLILSFFWFDLGQYLTLDYLKSQQAAIDRLYQEYTAATVATYFLMYVIVTGLSLPGAAIMTLLGGAIFGLLWGTVIVSFASTIGATLAFLVARFIFRDAIQQKFRRYMAPINEGVRRDGALYLFMLRLVPAFPFWVINLVMALTPMRVVTFFVVSQIGMLAGTIVFVNAGTQLARVDSTGAILSPGLIGAFVLLGIFPFLAKGVVTLVKRARALRGWTRPAHFDRNLVVIGGGSAGLVAAYIAAAVKAKVTLIEREAMGGDCLNTGCVPSKALIRSARLAADIQRHEAFGITEAHATIRIADVMARVRRVIAAIAPHDSVERYQSLGVGVIEGEARVTGPWTVEVNGTTITTRHIIIATGARPFVPTIPGIDGIDYWTSDTIWQMEEEPGQMVVLGGGPIGCEMSQAFQRLGASVTLVEMAPRILQAEDPDIATLVADRLVSEGISLRTGHKAVRFENDAQGQRLICERKTEHGAIESVDIPFDTLLVALGRQPTSDDIGLEAIGVTRDESGKIAVDGYLQTQVPTIYACGDGVGNYQFTHASAHEAWHATVNALFGAFRKFRVDYRYLPWVTFTDPEVAHVGLNEEQAQREGIDYEVTRYDLAELDRAIVEEEGYGVVKVLTEAGKDRLLGATIVGPHAGDLITQFTFAMKYRLGLEKILGTIHPYPTLAEANRFVAGEWKKAHAPAVALRMLKRFHAWRCG